MTKNYSNAWLNYISTKLVREVTARNGNRFISVSVPFEASKNGFATITVSKDQVFKTKNKDGTLNDNFRNILLGRPDAVRRISIMSDAINRTFDTIEITNEDLAISFRSQRNMYKRLKNSQKNSSSSTSPFEEEFPF